MTAEDCTDISESVNEANTYSPELNSPGHLRLEMFALSKKSIAEDRKINQARRKEEREQRALNIHKRNMVISYHSNSCNTTANSNLTQNKQFYNLGKDAQPSRVNQAQFYSYFKENKVGGTPSVT